MRSLLAILGHVVLAALALGACSRGEPSRSIAIDGGSQPAAPDASFPVTLRDTRGRSVTVRSAPHRIVALLPSHTETLFAVGAGDRVVGVDDSSDYPAEARALPRVGGLFDPHVEQIVALKPDLVIAGDGGAAPNRLAELGLTVWAGNATRIDDLGRLIEDIATLVGRREAGRALAARMRIDLDAEETRLEKLPRVRTYYELDPTPYTVGPESFLGVMIARAGGDNIVPRGLGDFPRIAPELVLQGDPDVILGVTAADAARRPGWSSLTAVKRGALEVLTPDEQSVVTRTGPRIAEGLAVLGRHLHRLDR